MLELPFYAMEGIGVLEGGKKEKGKRICMAYRKTVPLSIRKKSLTGE